MSYPPLFTGLDDYYLADETHCVNTLVHSLAFSPQTLSNIAATAEKLVIKVRETRITQSGLDAFLYQYDLSSDEGIALMCLAEALLRIPDEKTLDKLIRDKILQGDWEAHLGKSGSLFVNAATWGLMLTGKIISPASSQGLKHTLKKLIAHGGEPLIRKTAAEAMKILGRQFVMGRTIEEALKRARPLVKQGYVFSYDMLGEAARTPEDAERYFQAYQKAIDAIQHAPGGGISVKLSALHPRYEFAQKETVVPLITEKLLALSRQACAAKIGLTVDAEESERLDISLAIFSRVFTHPDLKNYEGLGLAVQSYQKRAFYLIDKLADLAHSQKKRLFIRLIKGAYWDSEIKNAQVKGLSGYPVFTRKVSTDVSFLACAKKLLDYPDAFYPAFATHNAYSLAAVLEMAGTRKDFEFQCLHGMGYTLYDQIAGKENLDIPCRVYAPVGSHEDLLAYLVRRLLENGANTSFVNRIIDQDIPVAEIIADPAAKIQSYTQTPHPHIFLPADIYGAGRKNARTINLNCQTEVETLFADMKQFESAHWNAYPTAVDRDKAHGLQREITSPDHQKIIGTLYEANANEITLTLSRAQQAFAAWEMTPVETRAGCLQRAADLLEKHLPEFMSLLILEAGKTLPDALAEIREAVDFCRYYASQALHHLAEPLTLPGPTGEINQLFLRGRGPIVCISPWNFPLAIFMGQVTAALVTGNPVIAKPAMQTTLTGMRAVQLLHEAGIPKAVVQLLPASGKLIGEKVIADTRIHGVIFTGSTDTAQQIQKTLAQRSGPIVPFIAETGGQNAMIVDSSALPEQVVQDVITSAFMSAGQRCSALRVLFIQEEIADKTLTMLRGAMSVLNTGDPYKLSTDIGPVIDNAAKETLEAHKTLLSETAKLLYEIQLPDDLSRGSFFGPAAFEIDALSQLTGEVFGPILHIIRYKSAHLDKIIQDINTTGYGLTMGIHSRIDETVQYIQKRIKAGNIYVNRNMIGAVVGVQPFGGEGLSGTGPKAGGPHYLLRLCNERTLTINTTAAGGNTSLMSLQDDASPSS
jgi:RHH-type proline utilization regulon transcriptional repressor/proline dehydrogenase/delta 1-pyrroline-5-carboxylate dehydrogenase